MDGWKMLEDWFPFGVASWEVLTVSFRECRKNFFLSVLMQIESYPQFHIGHFFPLPILTASSPANGASIIMLGNFSAKDANKDSFNLSTSRIRKAGKSSPRILVAERYEAINNDFVVKMYVYLVGGFNPFKHISQIGSFPHVGVKIIFETTT